jgi:hypothetical protein
MRPSIAVAVHLAIVTLIGCASNAIPAPELSASAPKTKIAEDAALFRELLYAQCRDSWTREDFARTVLLPDAALYAPNQTSFSTITRHFAKRRPEEFLRNSVGRAPKGTASKLEASGRPPVTLIVIPGLSAEAASSPLFPEVIDDERSSFARQVTHKLAAASRSTRMDRRYSLADLKEIPVPLDELVRTGSLDDAEGRPLVQLIYLHNAMGSLESYGRIEDLYPIYKRRLDKLFGIIGSTPRLYVVGHSRGAPIGLDLVARLSGDPSAKAWAKDVEGFVALNGALFGSHYANAFFDPSKQPYRAFHRHLAALRQLDEDAGVIDSIVNRHTIMTSLASMGAELMLSPYLRKEDWSYPPLPLSAVAQAKDFELQLKPHASYFGDYPRFVRRVKTLVNAAETAIRDLTHESRLKWWATHEIPSKLRYLTFSSTMASPVTERRIDRWQAALLDAPAAGRSLIEYQLLRGFYNGYYDDAGVGPPPSACSAVAIWRSPTPTRSATKPTRATPSRAKSFSWLSPSISSCKTAAAGSKACLSSAARRRARRRKLAKSSRRGFRTDEGAPLRFPSATRRAG